MCVCVCVCVSLFVCTWISVSMCVRIKPYVNKGGSIQQLHENATRYIKLILEATSYKTASVRPPTIHREDYPN